MKTKKILAVVLIIVMAVCFTSCGARWEQTKKNIKSNYSGGIERKITVTNMLTGEIVWENVGKSYIDGCSTVGNVTIIFYDSAGNSKKADFIGNLYGIHSIEF